MTDPDKWLRKKETVFKKFNGRCAYCGCAITIEKFQIDHIISKCQFYANQAKYINAGFQGIDSIDNLNPACFSCNNYKRAHDLETFRKEIEKQVERLRRDKPTVRLAERFGLLSFHPRAVKFYFEEHG